MSRAVAELERQLSARLFERVHRSVRLTRGGALYHEAVVAGLGGLGAPDAALAGAASVHVLIAFGSPRWRPSASRGRGGFRTGHGPLIDSCGVRRLATMCRVGTTAGDA